LGRSDLGDEREEADSEKVGVLMRLSVDIPGQPIPQKRPRVKRNGITFDPIECKQAKDVIHLSVIAKRLQEKLPMFEGDLGVNISFYGAHGASDIDNLCKLVLDGLKGAVYNDDKQVIYLHAYKCKGKKEEGKTVIEVWSADPI
jgi:Holliday junction resolvase RusA-like endonuclease